MIIFVQFVLRAYAYAIRNKHTVNEGFDLRFRVLEVHGSQFCVGFLSEAVFLFFIRLRLTKEMKFFALFCPLPLYPVILLPPFK
jgi:hypothetical protein